MSSRHPFQIVSDDAFLKHRKPVPTVLPSNGHQVAPKRTESQPSPDEKKVGRTPNGDVFKVPETEDMVSQLIDPRKPHNLLDAVIVAVNLMLMYIMYKLPHVAREPVFAVVFLFWRTCYNLGIGWLLHKQSKTKFLTEWAAKSQVLGKKSKSSSPSRLRRFVKTELEKKVAEDYTFEEAPVEYNTWLAFRSLVDLVLTCDFTSYCLFAATCGGRPVGEPFPITVARWTIGISLIIFNLWVKLDAHRVVKDYAWYWGDFFYLMDSNLTFDGVFQFFPHPMYSVGYAGYYGISLMAANYKVLLISIAAHLAQWAFLTVVEEPHIKKTYPSSSSESDEEASGAEYVCDGE